MASISGDYSTGLVSYWELEETSGTRVDSHGSNDLTDNNTVTYATGKQGNCASFASANTEYLSITTTPADLKPSALSISMWVKFATIQSGEKWLLDNGSANGSIQLFKANTTNRITWRPVAGGSTQTVTWTTAPSDSTWYHIVGTADSSEAILYINASQVAQQSYAGALATSAGNFAIGNYAGGGSYSINADIDEVGVWSRVLTSTEVTSLYNSGTGIPYSSASIAKVKTFNTIANASIKTLDTIAKASLKTVNTIGS